MRKISFLCLLLCAGLTVMAQSRPVFGAKAGVNISSISGMSGNSSGSKAGLHAGLLVHHHFTPEWSIQPEIMYSNQGGSYRGGGNHKLALHYINVPLQLQYNFDNGFRLQTGPQLGLLAGVSDKVNGNEVSGGYASDDFKTVDASWVFALSYLTYSGLGLDVRYNLGLSNIRDEGSPKWKNNVFQFGVFYLFDKDHKRKSR